SSCWRGEVGICGLLAQTPDEEACPRVCASGKALLTLRESAVAAKPLTQPLSPQAGRRGGPLREHRDVTSSGGGSKHHFTPARPGTAFAASAFNRSMMRVVEESGSKSTSTTLPPYASTTSRPTT